MGEERVWQTYQVERLLTAGSDVSDNRHFISKQTAPCPWSLLPAATVARHIANHPTQTDLAGGHRRRERINPIPSHQKLAASFLTSKTAEAAQGLVLYMGRVPEGWFDSGAGGSTC